MADISEIVVVNVVVQDAIIDAEGFGTPGIMTHEQFFGPHLSQAYSNTTDMVTAGADADGPTVAAATAILAQNPSVPSFKVLRRTSTPTTKTIVCTVNATNLEANTDYSVTINGTAFTFNSGATPTAASVALGLDAAINAGSEPVTSTDNLDGTFDLTEDVAGDNFSLVLGPNSPDVPRLTQQDITADAGVAADYAAIKVEDQNFYGVGMTSTAKAEISALAAVVEADRKIFIAQTADADVLTDGASNIGEVLNAAAYNRTALFWSARNFDYAAFRWFGAMLHTTPGSATWANQILAGLTADDLGGTEIANLKSNNVNYYTEIGGVNLTRTGQMASGRFIDVTRGTDWTEARQEEGVLSVIANNEKVKFTDEGIALIQGALQDVLDEGVDNGLYAASPAPVVKVPKASTISTADKAARTLTGITWTATLTGAIHHVIPVSGNVSV